MNDKSEWPPEGYVQIGNYAFEPPLVPSVQQLEEAEQFIFTNENFLHLDESQRRRNVIRLAIAAASSNTLPEEEGSERRSFVPLIGGVAQVTTVRYEGSPIFTFTLLEK